MRANELTKKSNSVEKILKEIEDINKNNPNIYKHFIPHFTYVSSDVIGSLISNGYKVYEGHWFANDHGLIIEW